MLQYEGYALWIDFKYISNKFIRTIMAKFNNWTLQGSITLDAIIQADYFKGEPSSSADQCLIKLLLK